MPYNQYSQFLIQLLLGMLQEDENYRPSLRYIQTVIRPYLSQTYFQEKILTEIAQQVPQNPIQNSKPQLKKTLSNVQLLRKTIMKSESKSILNDSRRHASRSPINHSLQVPIQAKPNYLQTYQGSNYSTDLQSQSNMQIPTKFSSISNQQPFFNQVYATRSIHNNNSKIISRENQFQRSSNSFYCSPGQRTFNLTPLSRTPQKVIITPLSRSPISQENQQYKEANYFNQIFGTPPIQRQVIKLDINQTSPVMQEQPRIVRKIAEQSSEIFNNSSKQFYEPIEVDQVVEIQKQDSDSESEKTSNNEQQQIGEQSQQYKKITINDDQKENYYQQYQQQQIEMEIPKSDTQRIDIIDEKITEVSKENEKESYRYEYEQSLNQEKEESNYNQDQEDSNQWQEIDNSEQKQYQEQQSNYIDVIEQRIKQALRNSQQTISLVKGQNQQ